MGIDKNLIIYLAKLANIEVQPEEEFNFIENIRYLANEFSVISEIENEVSQLNVIEKVNLREDIVINAPNNQEIMSNFHNLKNNLVLNPKILSKD
jgi:aspartyl/glutamyl-tRNA(Asn/Gln) amidotransferase C subunit